MIRRRNNKKVSRKVPIKYIYLLIKRGCLKIKMIKKQINTYLNKNAAKNLINEMIYLNLPLKLRHVL